MCNAIQTNFLYKILLQTPVSVKFFMGDQSFEIHGTHTLQFIDWHISLNGDLVWKACCKSFSEKYLSDGSFQLKDILNKCPCCNVIWLSMSRATLTEQIGHTCKEKAEAALNQPEKN